MHWYYRIAPKRVLIKHAPCRNPVFYLLSALGSDQQEPFDLALSLERPIFVSQAAFRVANTCAPLHFFRAAWLCALDTVHDFTSVLYPSETCLLA